MVRLLAFGKCRQEIRKQRPRRLGLEIGGKFVAQVVRIGEGKVLGVGFDEEIERIDHRHLGDEVDLDAEFVGRLRKHQPRQPIAVRILLPVDEMLGRRDLQRIARIAVRQCGAGRSRTICGPSITGRSYLYDVT